jgi:hypothetical protein
MLRRFTMGVDERGLEMTGSAEAVAAYDRAADCLIRFRPEVVDAAAAASTGHADPRRGGPLRGSGCGPY